jgi:hypothetical protein
MSLIAHYGDIYQVSYVAKDLGKAMDFLRTKMGAETFSLREPELTVAVGGQQLPLHMRVAVANVGRMQLEVIEPVSGATNIYTEGIDYGRSVLAFHHVGIAVPGPIESWSKLEREIHESGDSFALSFAYDNAGEAVVRFAYVDTRPSLGHYTEYLWWVQGMEAANAALPNLAS